MAYYRGERLKERLEAYGLLPLSKRLHLAGVEEVQFQATISTTPEQLERVRVTLYSLLSSLNLSSRYSLRTDRENNIIIMKEKPPPKTCEVLVDLDDMPEA